MCNNRVGSTTSLIESVLLYRIISNLIENFPYFNKLKNLLFKFFNDCKIVQTIHINAVSTTSYSRLLPFSENIVSKILLPSVVL